MLLALLLTELLKLLLGKKFFNVISKIKNIQQNRYPEEIIILENYKKISTFMAFGQQNCPVYLRLPRIGNIFLGPELLN